jgi:hypothetical protein
LIDPITRNAGEQGSDEHNKTNDETQPNHSVTQK